MIGTHCGARLVPFSDNVIYFKRRCLVCKKIFKQKKRRPINSLNKEQNNG